VGGPLYRRAVSKPGRPRVITHNVSSLDGRLGPPGVLLLHGDDRWSAIGGNEFTDMWALHEPQVQLEGSNSFVPRDAPGVDRPPASLVWTFTPTSCPRISSHKAASSPSWIAVVGSGGPGRSESTKSIF
jgi:2,5-diamino-6-(ribosylamino)-4(3H)-pyrimidinone 5'-phosphate reductase